MIVEPGEEPGTATAPSTPDGVDLEALSAYLPRYVPGAEGPLEAELISGGKSNLTYIIRNRRTQSGRTLSGQARQGRAQHTGAAQGEWVLRRPPLGHVLPTAHDMAREFRVISALGATDVPVPVALHLCLDTAIIGAPFYVMERVPGVIIHEELPARLADTPAERRRMSEVFIDALARLHSVDYEAAGLGDFGRPEGFMARQVRRWGEQWDRSKTREIEDVEELRRRLNAALPESPAPAVVHGDYRLENMIFPAREPGRIAAILDWEMSTLGDPLADLGYALMYWVQQGDSLLRQQAMDRGVVTMAAGFLTRAELGARYEEATGRTQRNVDFYTVFACYKLAIIVEGIVARHQAGETRGEGFEGYDEKVLAIAQLGREIAGASSIPALRGS